MVAASDRNEKSPRELALDEALAEYLRRLDAGQRPDVEQFLGHYPTIANDLRDLIDTASTVESMAAGESSSHDETSEFERSATENDWQSETTAPKSLPSHSESVMPGIVRLFGDIGSGRGRRHCLTDGGGH